MNKFLLVALVVFAPSVALAGGGGSSKNNTGAVKVTSDAPDATPIALIALDPSDSLKAATTLAQFKSRGGVVLNQKESYTFKSVKAGKHTIYVALVAANATTVQASDFKSKSLTVTKGNTLNVKTSEVP